MNNDINDNLTPQGGGNSKRNPNGNADTYTDASADAQDHSNGTQPSGPKLPVSEARLHANRENAKRSTGPKTARGKAYSRRNALTHGLLAKSVLFDLDGKPINEDLHQLLNELHEKYGAGDVVAELRIHKP